jgi:8-oxo-dGTP pyrophosphatase MutT (NUDIX family)
MVKPAKALGIQFAAIPFKIAADGLQVLLLTSRETHRWVIPKGWPIRGLKPREVAAREAFEEAGLVGRIVGKRPIGAYHYTKQLPNEQEMLCQVRVFLLSVDQELDDWPEKEQREACWVEPLRAAQMVQEGGLAELLRNAFPMIRRLEPKPPKRPRLHHQPSHLLP